ncbi:MULTISPECIES: type IV pilin protein [Legionella]|uniref:Type-IV pilin n=1 Tax=Legionella drozanskii LLAP-1 TaxID=1212489 RepID=A0A0W0SQG2_9GAMM|nr:MULTISPECIES: type IV pilin protein [Legionella]KTC85638.1 Type-IV pilin [Legionella drozanskii LLAP-1]PJE15157.1 MAG: prepilin-type cleavage/methylation domain-containing protein [Legionella sp.]
MINKGFSLIELMIVMMIISLFAVFTYPSYRNSMTQARRVDGQTALLALANRMEAYYSQQQSYQGATIATGNESDILGTERSEQNWYRLKITEQSDTRFSLQAIPIRAQATADELCQTLTFNSLGVKGITAGPVGLPKGHTTQCW